jgi:predicted transcriptional regulator
MAMTVDSDLDKMVQRVSWMSPIDYHILEFFEEHDIRASPKIVAANIDYDRQYTGKRLKALSEEGLFKREGEGIYSLTSHGRAFLSGKLDASELER